MNSVNYEDKDLLFLARLIAEAAHLNQKDKGGSNYIEHIKHVSYQFEGDHAPYIVALLHDVIEDSPLTSIGALKTLFGEEISEAVDAISRREAEQYFVYLDRCKANKIARRVKIADIKHNMDRSRWPEMPDSYFEREGKALEILEADD